MKRIALAIGSAALAFGAFACSDSSTAPQNQQIVADDVAQAAAISAGDATSEDVNLFFAADGALSGTIAGPSQNLVPRVESATEPPRYTFWAFSSSCAYDSATQRFLCPPVTKDGLTLVRSLAFFDANGHAMTAYDSLLTASANFQTTVSGVHVALAGKDTIARQRDMTATGLLGHETSRTWNGTGSRSDGGYRVDSTVTRTYHTTDGVAFANIVVSLPRTEHPWPMSGTVTRHVVGTATVVRDGVTRSMSVDKTVTITFNGTEFVPMTVGTKSFTLDLATGKAVRN